MLNGRGWSFLVLGLAILFASSLVRLQAAPTGKPGTCCGSENSCGICHRSGDGKNYLKTDPENKYYLCADAKGDMSKRCDEKLAYCYEKVKCNNYSDATCDTKLATTEVFSLGKDQCSVPANSPCPPP